MLALRALLVGCVLAQVACVRLTSRDAFPVGARPLELATLAPGATPLSVRAAGRDVAAWLVPAAGSEGVLVFYGGSGNDTEAQLRVLAPHAASLRLSLVVFSYYRSGEPVPTVSMVRAIADAVYVAAVAAAGPRAYVVGHSLGAWLASDVAASHDAAGLVLVGAETTSADVIRATIPIARIVSIRPDADSRQLDSSCSVPLVRVPTLVVSSDADADVPSRVTAAVYGQLPGSTEKRWLLVHGVTHGAYFHSAVLWHDMATLFHLTPQP